MALDLLVTGATLADGRAGIDIGIKDGRIAEIGPVVHGQAERTLDAAGRLVVPPFVDSHFHMDATLSLGLPRLNRSGTLLEGIALWGELKPLLTEEAVVERALAYVDLAVAQGIGAIRSHVDVCDPKLTGVRGLLKVREIVAPYLTLQLVAFPQDGLYRYPGARDLLLQALDMGVDVIGGIPHFERTMAEGTASVTDLCTLATERGLMIDLHCDETDDPLSRHIEAYAAEVQRHGLGGRATASHLTSMHSMDNYYASKLLPLIAESGMNVIANPLINIAIQGRHDAYPKRRGLTRVPEMLEQGIPVALGHDCVMDPWYSLGSGDMLDVAHMAIHALHMTSVDAMTACLDAVTTTPAAILQLEDYGLAVGCNADLVILDAADPVDAIRTKAARLHVLRRGKVIAGSPPRRATLALPGRPDAVSWSRPTAG
ncbi:amidohydrolase family protein [Marinivivus vitaminiproducens]|uniref:amidohydrolase family protein n=1 Tax=Marinivivus vitaminiproducens TaxID=3035935 RepID=UPI00279A3F95|nr:amidohydrolase family protein [Geminicoccaceae bacterium SCSIO 64248]